MEAGIFREFEGFARVEISRMMFLRIGSERRKGHQTEGSINE